MGHFLNFGPGPNMLGEPWQNLEPNHDIRKRLKFDNGSCSAVLAEHVIEHVSFLQGFAFLFEVLRVLEPGGTLRLAFPDIGRFTRPVSTGAGPLRGTAFSPRALAYAEGLALRVGGEWCSGVTEDELVRAAMLRMLTGWGHQMAWSSASASGVLLAVGFSTVELCDYGNGKIAGVDGHHRDVGPDLAALESTILEATK